MLVYRETSTLIASSWLVSELAREQRAPSRSLAALLRAGELECGLSDLVHPLANAAAELSDAAARALLGVPRRTDDGQPSLARFADLPELALTRPEGYAYYALDPLRYAELAAAHSQSSQAPVAVIGIRSIGTSLSAVVKAELERTRVSVERCTVRPQGHPWQRKLAWSSQQLAWLARHFERSDFIIVDEGPGLSGSTFLAVAEAVLALGVEPGRITLFGSHSPSPTQLVANHAAERWARFSFRAARPWSPPEAALDLSAGAWRAQHYASEAEWPCSWVQTERLKYLSADGLTLHKFSGFPPYDSEIMTRAALLADAGWSPGLVAGEPGFLASAWQKGRPARPAQDRTQHVLEVLARYAAFRARDLRAADAQADTLESMARVNASEALGLDLPDDFELELVNPVLVDGRMMPHEWIVQDDGQLLKTDSAHHADDHFYPGPADIAWDLAGAAVEWQLDPAARRFLAETFHRLTGDDVSRRLPAYELAYAAFRLGYVELAKLSSSAPEQSRLAAAGAQYRACLLQRLAAR
jgi:hypothetical protein